MQVTEIKNDLVQVRYDVSEQALGLGDFLIVSDNNSDILAQIVILEADDTGAFCVAKFILNVNKDNSASQYSGYMPSCDATVYPVSKREIIDFITPLSNGLKLGKLINSNYDVSLSNLILDEPLYIQSDYSPSCAKLIQFIYSNNVIENNTVFFDCDGTFSPFDANVAVLGENVKLPLNEFFINFIYNNDLDELTISQKALVQDILLEIKDYINTTEKDFIEFETLINVVDSQYQDQPDDALILFRNKLIEYRQLGYFANSSDEVQTIYNAINGNMTLFSCEKLAKNWQKALLTFVSENISQNTHFVIQATNTNIDEQIITSVLNSKSISPVFISNYSFDYRSVLRSKIANMIFFQAIDNLNDFPLYVNYLNILFDDSYIIWGDITSRLSIIASLNTDVTCVEEEPIQFDTHTVADVVDDNTIIAQNEDDIENLAEDINDIIIEENNSDLIVQDENTEEEIISEPTEEVVYEQDEEQISELSELSESEIIEDDVEEIISENDTDIQENAYLDENNVEYEENVCNEDEELIQTDDVADEQLEIVETTSDNVPLDIQADENISEDIEEDDLDNLDNLDELTSDDLQEVDNTVDGEQVQENDLEKLVDGDDVLEQEDENVIVEENNEDIESINVAEDEATLKEETDVENQNSDEISETVDIVDDIENDLDEISENNETLETIEDEVLDDEVVEEEIEEKTEQQEVIEENYAAEDEEEIEQVVEEQQEIDDVVEEPKFQMPVYDSDVVEQPQTDLNAGFVEGNLVFHEKYGKGIIEKVISYGAKTLCSIQFDNVGRRLLDPNLADLKHV